MSGHGMSRPIGLARGFAERLVHQDSADKPAALPERIRKDESAGWTSASEGWDDNR
jgi:hypothetical protein